MIARNKFLYPAIILGQVFNCVFEACLTNICYSTVNNILAVRSLVSVAFKVVMK